MICWGKQTTQRPNVSTRASHISCRDPTLKRLRHLPYFAYFSQKGQTRNHHSGICLGAGLQPAALKLSSVAPSRVGQTLLPTHLMRVGLSLGAEQGNGRLQSELAERAFPRNTLRMLIFFFFLFLRLSFITLSEALYAQAP